MTIRALIKEKSKNLLFSDFVLTPKITRYPFDIKKAPNGYFKSFGESNPDKVFYVIWRDNYGSGFFSNLQQVLAHLRYADLLGMIPVVDFANFKTLYNEDLDCFDTRNAWEYYFNQVSKHSLEEVYRSRRVFFCDGSFSWNMGHYLSPEHNFYKIYLKYVDPQKRIVEKVANYWNSFGENNRILGVHFRGKEQNLATGHPFGPTKQQMTKCTDDILDKYSIDKIFIVSEDQEYVDHFVKRYGNKVLFTDSFRSRKINAYKIYPRHLHKYSLGEEVMIDAFLLSKCTGLVYSSSNVSQFACFLNSRKFEFKYFIDNGVNSNNPLIAKYLYRIKKHAPMFLGGLQGKVDICEESR